MAPWVLQPGPRSPAVVTEKSGYIQQQDTITQMLSTHDDMELEEA